MRQFSILRNTQFYSNRFPHAGFQVTTTFFFVIKARKGNQFIHTHTHYYIHTHTKGDVQNLTKKENVFFLTDLLCINTLIKLFPSHFNFFIITFCLKIYKKIIVRNPFKTKTFFFLTKYLWDK